MSRIPGLNRMSCIVFLDFIGINALVLLHFVYRIPGFHRNKCISPAPLLALQVFKCTRIKMQSPGPGITIPWNSIRPGFRKCVPGFVAYLIVLGFQNACSWICSLFNIIMNWNCKLHRNCIVLLLCSWFPKCVPGLVAYLLKRIEIASYSCCAPAGFQNYYYYLLLLLLLKFLLLLWLLLLLLLMIIIIMIMIITIIPENSWAHSLEFVLGVECACARPLELAATLPAAAAATAAATPAVWVQARCQALRGWSPTPG